MSRSRSILFEDRGERLIPIGVDRRNVRLPIDVSSFRGQPFDHAFGIRLDEKSLVIATVNSKCRQIQQLIRLSSSRDESKNRSNNKAENNPSKSDYKNNIQFIENIRSNSRISFK
jgi:hypothetical protein